MKHLKEDIDQFGLRSSDLAFLHNLFEKTDEIEQALIFGSRAKGNHKTGSDVDLALQGEKLNPKITSHIHYILEEESPMPYFFDVVDYTHLDKKELREYIDKVGVVIYSRNS